MVHITKHNLQEHANYFNDTDIRELQTKVRELNALVSKTFSQKIHLSNDEAKELIDILMHNVDTSAGVTIVQTPTNLGPTTVVYDTETSYRLTSGDDI